MNYYNVTVKDDMGWNYALMLNDLPRIGDTIYTHTGQKAVVVEVCWRFIGSRLEPTDVLISTTKYTGNPYT